MVILEDIAVTDHALARYQRRLRLPHATRDDVLEVIRSGRFREESPDGIDLANAHEDSRVGFVVNGTAVFPLKRCADGAVIATTCLKRRRRSKEERRALRDVAREAFGF